MIDGENSNFKIYEKIGKIATSKGDDYTTGCLLGYTYFKENYKMIAVDVSKQQALHAVSRAIQQINFTANLDRAGNKTMFFIIAGNTTMFFIIDEAKNTVLDFSHRTVKVL